jgi:asparagine synthase (glutamine-hydrolysing)
MFAFAIWDARRKRLFFARDRMGQKPLIYRQEEDRLLFASEAKALLQVPGVPREVDPTALHDYLVYQYVPEPRTIYRGLSKLPPGHYGVYESGRLTIGRYWDPHFDVEEPLGFEEYRRQLRQTMTDAVRLRLRSDVPLGAFLSGGVDSTVIVGLMQELSERPVQTFSIGFPVTGFDETGFARSAAEYLKTEHREFKVTPNSAQMLPKLVWYHDEPFADSSAIPTFYLSRVTRQHVTVALTGDGGDELFAGYPRGSTYAQVTRWGRLPWPIPSVLRSRLWDAIPNTGTQSSIVRRIQFRLGTMRETPERRYLHWVRLLNASLLSGLYTDEFRAKLADHDECAPILEAFRRCPRRDPLTQSTIVDLLTYLPGALLVKVDIASMAYALEARSPMLDHHVVELASRMPIDCKVRNGVRKRVLKEAHHDLLPNDIQGRGKMGFCVPLDEWFRGDLREMVHDLLLDRRSVARGYFRLTAIEKMLAEHDSGAWNHGDALWALLFLETWHRMFIDPSVAPSSEPAGIPEQSIVQTSGGN